MFVQYYKSDVSVEETFGVPLMAMTVDFLLLFYFVFFFFAARMFEMRKMKEGVQNCPRHGLSTTTTTILVTQSLPLISLKLKVDWK